MAITSDARPHTAERTGIGLRLPHIAEVVATRPPVGWLEIHPENFLANPHGLELLTDLARDYPISVHTVGISIGSADGIDRDHLRRLRDVGRSAESGPRLWTPRMVHGGWRVSQRSLAVAVHSGDASRCGRASRGGSGRARAARTSSRIPQPYVSLATSTMTELEFLHALVNATGCRLLCDVSNVHLSGHNMGYDPYRYIDEFPAEAVAELHLGGFTPEDDEATPGGTLLVDTHAHAVARTGMGAVCARHPPLRPAAHDRRMGQRSAGASRS